MSEFEDPSASALDSAPSPSPSPSSSFEDLATEQLGARADAPPTTPDSTDEFGQQPSVSGGEPQRSAQAPTAPAFTFEYDGRRITPEELAADPQLMLAAVTRANQAAHFQKLYENAAFQPQPQQPQAPPPPPQQPQGQQPRALSPDELRFHMKPVVDGYVAQGFVEPDFAEAFPNAMASFAFVNGQLADTREALAAFMGAAQHFVRENQQKAVVGEIDQRIAGLASRGELYADLGQPQAREQFKNWLYSFNPPVGFLRNPDWVAQQWMAYTAPNIQDRVQTALSTERAREAADRRRRAATRGDGVSSRPAGPPPAPAPANPWDVLATEALGR